MLRQILLSLIVVTTLVTSDDVSSSPRPKPKVISSVNELSLQERLGLLFLQKIDPSYNNLPEKLLIPPVIIRPQDGYTNVDGFLEFAPFFLQSEKWKDSLPEINWRFGISLCFEFWNFCIDQAWGFTSSNSKLLGTDTVSLKTDWTENSFTLNYTIGNFTWDGPNGTILIEDFITGGAGKCQGAWAKVQNFTMLITSNFTFDDELGIQLDGVKISFALGNFSYGYGYGHCVFKEFGEEETVYDGYLVDATQSYIDAFEEFNREFEFYLLYRMNCFFSDGKYYAQPPEDYEDYEDWEFSCYYDQDRWRGYGQSAALQFLQTMVMAGLYS